MADITILLPGFPEESRIPEIRMKIEEVLADSGITGEIRFPEATAGSPGASGPLAREGKTGSVISPRASSKWLFSAIQGETSEFIIVITPEYLPYFRSIPGIYREMISGRYDLVPGTLDRAGKGKGNLQDRVKKDISRLLFPHIPDPTCGFFGMKKSAIRGAELDPSATCLLLEIVAKGSWTNVHAISLSEPDAGSPGTREENESLSAFLRQILAISLYSVRHRESAGWKEMHNVIKFGIVGASGVLVNMGVLYTFTEFLHIYYLLSSAAATELSIVTNFALNDFWTFGNEKERKMARRSHRFISYNIVSLGNVAINIGALYFFTEILGINYLVSNFIGIIIAFSWSFVVNRRITWSV